MLVDLNKYLAEEIQAARSLLYLRYGGDIDDTTPPQAPQQNVI